MGKTKNINFKKRAQELGYRTPDRFKAKILARTKLPFTARPRSLGGHQ